MKLCHCGWRNKRLVVGSWTVDWFHVEPETHWSIIMMNVKNIKRSDEHISLTKVSSIQLKVNLVSKESPLPHFSKISDISFGKCTTICVSVQSVLFQFFWSGRNSGKFRHPTHFPLLLTQTAWIQHNSESGPNAITINNWPICVWSTVWHFSKPNYVGDWVKLMFKTHKHWIKFVLFSLILGFFIESPKKW